MINKSAIDVLEFSKTLSFISRYAVTELGKKQITALLPFANSTLAMHEGALVTEAKKILIESDQPPFEELPDITDDIAMSRIDGAVLSAKKLLAVLRLATCSRLMYQYLKQKSELAPMLIENVNTLFVDKMFERHFSLVFDESGEIRDNASKDLQRIRADIKDKNLELRRMVTRISKNLAEQDLLREEFLTLRDGRVVLPIKVEHKRHIRGFIHSESATGQTVYIEPEETLHLNNELVTLSFAEKREIERILKELTRKVGEHSGTLRASMETIAYLDSLFARAQYSIEIIGGYPQIIDEGTLRLQDARHPILLHKIGREHTVPLSLEITPDKKIVVITGPNAGGKTVVLKTVGLLTLMVFAGIHIPASPDSVFPQIDSVFVDIGDRQSLEEDLSTFSSHLSTIKYILEHIGKQSLVLLDELGTGTDPAAGSALGAAILFSLQARNSFVLASTHHGDLKVLSHSHSGFQNAAMEFDTLNLTPTYYLKQGLPGSSYAFEIVKRLGFPEEFIAQAKTFVSGNQNNIENTLIEIEQHSRELREKLNAAERENARLKGLSAMYQQRVEKLETDRVAILKKAKEEAETFLQNANKDIERTIKQVRETQAAATAIRGARETVNRLRTETSSLTPKKQDEKIEEKLFAVDQFVRIMNSGSVGKIASVDLNKKTAKVFVGNLSMTVPFKDLEPSDKKAEKATRSSGSDTALTAESYRLDIRGQKPEDIEYDVLRFIDSAYSNNIDRVEILHGKGHGVLKKMVRDLLKDHSGVKSFYFAPVETGGEGITIVEFKS